MKNLKKKIPVAILGATGIVGQKFIELLLDHPWFEIAALAASERSQGKKYGESIQWMMEKPLPQKIAQMELQACTPTFSCPIAFSGLGALVAREIEKDFAESGYLVISNARNHRMDCDVPLVIPAVNGSHIELVKSQCFGKGMIVTNPNCSVIGLATALKPLVDAWEIEKAHVVTLQAISGAGYPGVPSFDILDNVIPYIAGEEEKLETEPLKILGTLSENCITPYQMHISAQCNRVAVMDGHMQCVSIKLRNTASAEEIIHAWENFSEPFQTLRLPSSPSSPIRYFTDERHPQPKLHRNINNGMTVSIGRLRKCPLLDWKFVLLSHNTILGAAGCAILNAELMLEKGYLSDHHIAI